MPRNLTTSMVTALCASVIRPALLVELNFGLSTASPLYIWSGVGSLTWNSMTFTGVGDLGQIGAIEETAQQRLEAKGFQLSLSGIPSYLVNDVLNDTRLSGTCTIWLALFTASNGLIDSPIEMYSGMIDSPEITDNGSTITCSIQIENPLVDLNRAVFRRYTPSDQESDLADTLTRLGLASTVKDTGFSHVAGSQEEMTDWGQNPSSNAS